MSPILSARLPAGLADLVAFPADAAEIGTTVALAHRHGVPVTVRGKGTGNYGQAIPLHDGLVVDTSRADRVLDVGDGWLRAEAGTTFVALEAAARATGQELALVPSTVGSLLGGFLAGGAGGTGSLENGFTWDGYVRALDVVPATDEAAVVTVEGGATRPMVHAYGTTGVIATATVALRPLRDWTALMTSFASYEDAVRAGLELMTLDPVPRLMSLDEPAIVAAYARDPAMPAGRTSVRAIVDTSTLAQAETLVRAAGGLVEAVRPKGPALLTSLSFNHTTHRVRKARPELCHLQVMGDVLVAEPDAIRATLPDTLLHLDGFRGDAGPTWAGMVMCRYTTPEDLYAGMAALRDLGVLVDDPHTWELGGDPTLMDLLRATAARMDPDGLLNPGKLPPARG
jgi:FAD/FMN-containing dehydrogenase